MTTTKKIIQSKDATDIYYERYSARSADSSDADRPVLFFIHGVGGDLDAWQSIKDSLSEKGFSSIAMDLRGHGKSGHPHSVKKYSLEHFIADFIAILNAEKIDRVVLIGHSLGAVLATRIALRHPERIQKLILISSSHLPPAYFKIPGIFLLVSALAAISPPPIRPRHSIYPPGKHHKDVEIFGLAKTILRNSLKSYLISSKEILKSDIAAELQKIDIPTLIISGDTDSVFPSRISTFIHSQIPRSRLKIIAGANHVVILNNAPETIGHISDFLG